MSTSQMVFRVLSSLASGGVGSGWQRISAVSWLQVLPKSA
jgi:hypothetical protein